MSSENQIAHRKGDCDLLVQTGHVYNFAEIDVAQNLVCYPRWLSVSMAASRNKILPQKKKRDMKFRNKDLFKLLLRD